MTPAERQLRTKLRDDFEFYAPRALRIRTKQGTVYPFRLNTAQRFLHSRLEEQKRRTGRVRALVLKGRQQGVSTYTEGRFFWLTTHRRGFKAFILTHQQESTDALFGMAKRFYEHCPQLICPSTAASNAREITFDKLDSGYKVSTAGSKGTGRGETLQLFHGSEVAYWPNADTHVAGALQAVPDAPGTEIILESTAAGPNGLFADMCFAAMRGEGEYQLVFIPWFWQQEYRKPVPEGFTPTADELTYQHDYGLDLEQMVWRRAKIVELNGVHNFRREYPATAAEAFSAEVPGALWTRDQIHNLRVPTAPELKRIVVAIDPSGGDKERNDECGIVVVGVDAQKHGYVLADHSGRYSPEVWGSKAVALYRRYQADRIVAEKNFGGDMVDAVIRMVDRNAPVKLVTASRGKHARAEPVAALYEQGRVHHVGELIGLEDEMVTWVPLTSTDSPNRIDACISEGSLVSTITGDVPIEDIRVGDLVLTRSGHRKVTAARLTNISAEVIEIRTNSARLKATADHLLYSVDRGYVRVDTLVCGDMLLRCIKKASRHVSFIERSSSNGGQIRRADATAFIISPSSRAVSTKVSANSMLRFGVITTTGLRCRAVLSSIISTIIRSTTNHRTSNACHENATPTSTANNTFLPSGGAACLIASGRLRQIGTGATQVEPGIVSTAKLLGRAELRLLSYVLHVARRLRPSDLPGLRTVLALAAVALPTTVINTMFRFLAQFAERLIGAANTDPGHQFAPEPVLGLYAVNERAKVYDLSVEGDHEFFANGLLVHNCVWGITELLVDGPGTARVGGINL